MSIQISHAADHTLVQFQGALTIAEALDTRDQLALALATSQRVDIDLSAVIDIDTAGIQLLLALFQESVPVAISAASDTLHTLLRSLNLLSPLGLEH